jgi:hypothetical protein
MAGIGDKLYEIALSRYSDAAIAGKLTGMLMDAASLPELEALIGDSETLETTLSSAYEALQGAAAAAAAAEADAASLTQEASDPSIALPAPSGGDDDVNASADAAPEDAIAALEAAAVPQRTPPAGPKDLLNAIKWHPGITFADVSVDFRKRKSSGKLSKRVTASPFIAFSFSQLDKVEDEQIEQVLWKGTPVYQKSRLGAQASCLQRQQ